jgi:hypothetical protein
MLDIGVRTGIRPAITTYIIMEVIEFKYAASVRAFEAR